MEERSRAAMKNDRYGIAYGVHSPKWVRVTVHLTRTIVETESYKVSVPTWALQLYIDTLSGSNAASAIRVRVDEALAKKRELEGIIILKNNVDNVL